jgi:hypothetical protein
VVCIVRKRPCWPREFNRAPRFEWLENRTNEGSHSQTRKVHTCCFSYFSEGELVSRNEESMVKQAPSLRANSGILGIATRREEASAREKERKKE